MSIENKPVNNRSKLALIPLLVGILGWRIADMTGLFDTAKAAVQLANAGSASGTETKPKTLLEKLEADRNARIWPKRSTNQIAQHDPFALAGRLRAEMPSARNSANVNTVQRADEAFRQEEAATISSPVQAILRGPDGSAAIVGNRIVRVGDFVETNLQVIAIESDAVVLQVIR